MVFWLIIGTIYNQSGAWYADAVTEMLIRDFNKLVGGGQGEFPVGYVM